MNYKSLFAVILILTIAGLGIYGLLQFDGLNNATGNSDAQNMAAALVQNTGQNDNNPEKRLYNIPVEDLQIVQSTIKRNQFLADILLAYGIDYPTIDRLVKKSKDIFDVRYIMAGRPYCILYKEDSIKKARYFIYEKNTEEFIVFDLHDTLDIYIDKKPVELKSHTAAGIIESSLYLTLTENALSPLLALELADIYAWTIDFYRLQKGDKFKVIYNVKYIDGQPAGVSEIVAAYFEHMGNDFYAFRFTDNDKTSYFDEQGNSLRKAFLKAPLKFSRITSGYSLRRFHPVQKVYKPHLGTDYAAPAGTPIMATGDGVVVEATYKKYNGNYVKIRHNSVYETQYLHMSKIAEGIKPGVKVVQGQVIGYVGSTGLATGPHVCYRFWKNGKQIDSRKVELPPSEPVSEENREAFFAIRDSLKQILDGIEYPAGNALAIDQPQETETPL